MIYLEETLLDENTVIIKLKGTLDQAAIPVIKEICDGYLERHRMLYLDLEKLVYITREGRNYLNGIKQKVQLMHVPEFMRLAGGF